MAMMVNLTPDEQTVADAIKRSGYWDPVVHGALARIAVAALDLSARDARIRAEVAREIARCHESSDGYCDIREHATKTIQATGKETPQ